MQEIPMKPKVVNLMKPKKKCFSIEEDAIILYLVQHIGTNWREIAKQLPQRTERQCRERYKTYLNPTLRHDPWTAEEDALLITLYNKIGPKWAEMAKFFPGRADNTIKNRYNTHIIHRPRNIAHSKKKNETKTTTSNSDIISVQQTVPLSPTSDSQRSSSENDDSIQTGMEDLFNDCVFADDAEYRNIEYVL